MGRVRIRVGEVEVECEGTEQFLKDELPLLLDSVSNLHQVANTLPSVGGTPGLNSEPLGSSIGTINTIAARLGVASGPELVLAAAARLTLGEGQSPSTRQALHEEMKKAASYFRKTYTNNLSQYLANLVKSGKLIESARGTYALSAATLSEMKTKLAN